MEQRKILIVIILIALIALIGFNFEKITGKAITNKIPIVSVYKTNFPEQNIIKPGDYITIKIQVGEYSVEPPIYLECSTGLETLNKNFGISTLRPGYGTGRDENIFMIDYKTHSDWEGECYARVYYWKDRKTKDYIDTYFEFSK